MVVEDTKAFRTYVCADCNKAFEPNRQQINARLKGKDIFCRNCGYHRDNGTTNTA